MDQMIDCDCQSFLLSKTEVLVQLNRKTSVKSCLPRQGNNFHKCKKMELDNKKAATLKILIKLHTSFDQSQNQQKPWTVCLHRSGSLQGTKSKNEYSNQ